MFFVNLMIAADVGLGKTVGAESIGQSCDDRRRGKGECPLRGSD
jgi:hypothetical protein